MRAPSTSTRFIPRTPTEPGTRPPRRRGASVARGPRHGRDSTERAALPGCQRSLVVGLSHGATVPQRTRKGGLISAASRAEHTTEAAADDDVRPRGGAGAHANILPGAPRDHRTFPCRRARRHPVPRLRRGPARARTQTRPVGASARLPHPARIDDARRIPRRRAALRRGVDHRRPPAAWERGQGRGPGRRSGGTGHRRARALDRASARRTRQISSRSASSQCETSSPPPSAWDNS